MTQTPSRGAASPRSAPRIIDVAALAGVSAGTVSKALSGTGQLRASTVERVRVAAAQLGFTPDGPARALKSGRSYTVGLLTTDSFGRFSIPVMLGAEDALGAEQMAIFLCDTRDDPLREEHYLRSLLARRVDGLIVTGRRTEPRPPLSVPVPVVYVFTPAADASATSVVSAQVDGAAALVQHLVDTGRRRIAHVTGPGDHLSATVRAEAGTAAARAAGVLSPGVPTALFGDWSERWGRLAVDLVLARDAGVDAICAGSDQIARGVCDRLRELGRRVPDDVAVTGFDDWDVMATACRPPLTTVDLQLEQLGRRAAGLLVEAVGGHPSPGEHQVPARLVVRESTVGT